MSESRKFSYDFPRPAVTVDVALYTVSGSLNSLRLEVLLIERQAEPFAGMWALPGGFVRQDEDLLPAAMRELGEETGIEEAYVEQVAAIGTPGRDPRGHTVTVLWAGLVPGDRCTLRASGDAAAVRWFPMNGLPRVAFDHERLIGRALEHMRVRLDEVPICFELLPRSFTLSELQAVSEAILGRELDRRNFRRKVQEMGFVEPAVGLRKEGAHRPARLFTFARGAFEAYTKKRRALPF